MSIRRISTLFASLRRDSRIFIFNDRGQDLVEYTLLLAFVVLAVGGTLASMGKDTKGVWTYNNEVFSKATDTVASSGYPPGFGHGAGNSNTGTGTGTGNGNSYGNANGNGNPGNGRGR